MDGEAMDVISEHVIHFYQTMSEKLETKPLFKGMFELLHTLFERQVLICTSIFTFEDFSEETISRTMDFVERYVTVRLYRLVFCSPATDDEDQDLAIQDKIRRLHWMNAYLLDAQLDERIPNVRAFVDQAVTGGLPMFVALR